MTQQTPCCAYCKTELFIEQVTHEATGNSVWEANCTNEDCPFHMAISVGYGRKTDLLKALETKS